MDASSQDRKNFLQSSERAAQFHGKIYTDSIGCPTDDTRVEVKSVSFYERGTSEGEDPYSNVKISLFESESPSLSHHPKYLPQILSFPFNPVIQLLPTSVDVVRVAWLGLLLFLSHLPCCLIIIVSSIPIYHKDQVRYRTISYPSHNIQWIAISRGGICSFSLFAAWIDD